MRVEVDVAEAIVVRNRGQNEARSVTAASSDLQPACGDGAVRARRRGGRQVTTAKISSGEVRPLRFVLDGFTKHEIDGAAPGMAGGVIEL